MSMIYLPRDSANTVAHAKPVPTVISIKLSYYKAIYKTFFAITAVLLLFAIFAALIDRPIFITACDAGRVRPSTTITHTFSVINLSWKPVSLSTFSTCGCTTVEVMHEHLSGFSRKYVSVTINTAGMEHGEHTKQLILFCESKNRNWHETAEVHFEIE